VIVFEKFLIDGEWVAPDGRGHFDVHDASTEELIGRIPDGSRVDVDRAVAAARRAFQPWAETAPARRAQVLREIAEGIKKRREQLVDVILGELGAPRPMTEQFMVDFPASTIQFYAELAATHPFEERIGNSLVVKEPVGVVAAITPWNYPLHQIVAKLGPALAAGCSVVLKPSEVVPLSCFMLAEIVNETSIPRGVFNFLSGAGAVVGEAMVTHPEVDMVSFTGSTEVGRMFLRYSSESNLKEIVLECGGKSPQVVMADASDLDLVAENVVLAGFANMGENCTCGSRLIVHRSVRDELLERIVAKTADWTVGDPQDPATKIGPMIEGPHLLKVLGYIGAGREEGARVVVGGNRVLPETGGYFVEPTVFDGVDDSMTIAREEIFGPVISTIVFDSEDEGLALANATNYGLHAAVYTNDLDTAVRAARTLRAGTVSVNAYSEGDITTPFGGFKESGFGGRDKGLEAFDQYTEKKTVWISVKG
jgi:gamma-glutamyl-gamma-aminobutyraldehyde dehydrogenase